MSDPMDIHSNSLRCAAVEQTTLVSPPGRTTRAAGMEVSTRCIRLPEEYNLLFKTWLKSYRKSHFARDIDDSYYFACHRKTIENMLAREIEVLVATPVDDDDTVLGWLCHERLDIGHVLHFAYTKFAFQGNGIMRALSQAAGLDLDTCLFTHLSDDARRIWRKHPGAAYVPYLIA